MFLKAWKTISPGDLTLHLISLQGLATGGWRTRRRRARASAPAPSPTPPRTWPCSASWRSPAARCVLEVVCGFQGRARMHARDGSGSLGSVQGIRQLHTRCPGGSRDALWGPVCTVPMCSGSVIPPTPTALLAVQCFLPQLTGSSAQKRQHRVAMQVICSYRLDIWCWCSSWIRCGLRGCHRWAAPAAGPWSSLPWCAESVEALGSRGWCACRLWCPLCTPPVRSPCASSCSRSRTSDADS